MKKWKLYSGLCLLFLAGVIVGGAGTLTAIALRVRSVVNGGPDAIPDAIVQRMTHKLDLSQQQVADITPIVDDAARQFLELRRREQPERDAIMQDAVARINTHLTPEQRQMLADRVAEIRARIIAFQGSASVPTPAAPGSAADSVPATP